MDMEDLLRKTLEKQAQRGQNPPNKGKTRGPKMSKNGDRKLGGGRSLHLSYLIKDKLISPGSGVLKMEYFGNVFEGDLLEDGQVQWKDTALIFSTPSAWASHCKRLVNPEQKNACGWTTVRYNGKKLEWYKNKWLQLHGGRSSDGGGSPHGTQDEMDDMESEPDENASHVSHEGSASGSEGMTQDIPTTPTPAPPGPPEPIPVPSSSQQPSTSSAPPPAEHHHQQQQQTFDVAVLAQKLLSNEELSEAERLVLEKALLEQAGSAAQAAAAASAPPPPPVQAAPSAAAAAAAAAAKVNEAELLKQHVELAQLLGSKEEEQTMLWLQQDAILQAQLQQEALYKIQQEILAVQSASSGKETMAKERKSKRKAAAAAAAMDEGAVLQKTLLENEMIRNALINQAALEKAIQEHNASGSKDKMAQLILEQALVQHAHMIQLAVAQLEQQAKARVVEPEAMLEARQEAVPPESALMDCVKFCVVGQKQPYTVYISSNSLLLMDYHCHLSTEEVSGYLGGTWNPNKLTLHVKGVFPCSLANATDQKECGQLQDKIRELIAQQDMTVIGWYHSHPTSSPRPSQHDIVCQSVHQQHMRSLDGRIDPCLGVIISPFRGQSTASEMQLFCVMHTNDGRPVPMHLEYTCMWDATISQELATEMRAMAILYSHKQTGVKFHKHWRNNLTIFQKMVQSLKQKAPKDISDTRFVDILRHIVAKEE